MWKSNLKCIGRGLWVHMEQLVEASRSYSAVAGPPSGWLQQPQLNALHHHALIPPESRPTCR